METAIRRRNPYLITRALRTFMWASILAAVSNQLATTTDAVVVSNLIGPDAMSAINVVMPVLTLFTCLMILFGIGASIVAAKAIGRCDDETSNGMFTSCLISSGVTSMALALLMYLLSPIIVEALTQGNEGIYSHALPYLRSMSLFVPFLMLAGVLENFVKTDGNPQPEECTGFDIAMEEIAMRDTDAYREAKEWYMNTFGSLEVDSVPMPDTHDEEIRFVSHDRRLGVGSGS